MTLKETREKYCLTQENASRFLSVPLRTYRRFEVDNNYGNALKRVMMISKLVDRYEIREDRGILTLEQIKHIVTNLFDNEYKNQIEFCYLFGSYAKNCPKENSDVDLFVSSSLKGIDFVGLVDDLRKSLHKKVDVIRPTGLVDNVELTNQIMKYGIKIYG